MLFWYTSIGSVDWKWNFVHESTLWGKTFDFIIRIHLILYRWKWTYYKVTHCDTQMGFKTKLQTNHENCDWGVGTHPFCRSWSNISTAVGNTKYFPFRKIMICVCRPNKQKIINYICESATGVKIYLCLKLRKFNHMFIFHTDIIRSIKLSIKPHSSAPRNTGQRAFIMVACVCVQAKVSCGACALLTVISQWSNDTNNKIIQIYGHTLIYLRCMAYAFVWHCLS